MGGEEEEGEVELCSMSHCYCVEMTSQKIITYFSALSTYFSGITPRKTNMTVENQPFEDVFPIKNDDFPVPC